MRARRLPPPGKLGVVEVPGEHAGWLALQAGIAVCADAVLIPEIPYDLAKVAARLTRKISTARHTVWLSSQKGQLPPPGMTNRRRHIL